MKPANKGRFLSQIRMKRKHNNVTSL